ncbi:hypothetical protein WJX82_005594 [Trebouxia sp. C0006]
MIQRCMLHLPNIHSTPRGCSKLGIACTPYSTPTV